MSPAASKNGHFPLTLSVKLKYVKLGYHYLVTNSVYLLLIPLAAVILTNLSTANLLLDLCTKNSAILTVTSISLALIATVHVMRSPRKVYLLDFACYKPFPGNLCSKETHMRVSSATGRFTAESLDFQRKILERSGYGQKMHAPAGLMATPPDQSMAAAREETEAAMFGAIDDLLDKSRVEAREIGVLVVNSSTFNPTPSLSAAIVNHYKLRGNVLSFNLGGMGCSAGLIAVDLAKRLLQVHPHTYALVVSTENICRNWYLGNHRPMLVSNCLFRVGASAVLLTNRRSERRRSKYQLLHTVRTHKGADDRSYRCVFQEEDQHNIVFSGFQVKKIEPYIPDFKMAFEHFCVHAGGRSVLDEVEKSLGLTEWHMEPSRMTLYRFGNTSSSSLWYELAYSEAKGRVMRGDRVWQIGFGSGFKCNSAVWRALRDIGLEEKNSWDGEIDEFPVHVPRVAPIVY
ncbi:unnamed protein product [Linum tenue]|uniref:3-ketoacyl-CoA synthase n=1 Tax=Linum tenue TaxID=586396 RepID=A0AAV0RQF7_9ROSI|nr:unnamed protein product [Linum tenue]